MSGGEGERREQSIAMLEELRGLFEAAPPGMELEDEIRALAERSGWKFRDVMMTLRVALTGSRVTPPILPSAALLGREECLARLDTAVAWLRSA